MTSKGLQQGGGGSHQPDIISPFKKTPILVHNFLQKIQGVFFSICRRIKTDKSPGTARTEVGQEQVCMAKSRGAEGTRGSPFFSSWHPNGREQSTELVICRIPRWWFQTFFVFTSPWGNDPTLLIFFKLGRNHQLESLPNRE